MTSDSTYRTAKKSTALTLLPSIYHSLFIIPHSWTYPKIKNIVKIPCYSKSTLPKFTIHHSPFIIFRIGSSFTIHHSISGFCYEAWFFYNFLFLCFFYLFRGSPLFCRLQVFGVEGGGGGPVSIFLCSKFAPKVR